MGTEKVSGRRKEAEEDDEVVVVRVKWRRTESESEWRREVELKLFGMDARIKEGFEEMAVENEVTGVEVGEDGEAEKGADVEME